MKDLLKFKPGDIIIITIGLPLILILCLKLFLKGYNNPTLEDKLVFVIIMMGVVAFISWIWSVVIVLHEKAPDHIKINITTFKTSLLIPLIYVIILVLLIVLDSPTKMSAQMKHPIKTVDNAMGIAFVVVKTLSYLSAACILYCLYFVAKTFKTVELQRKVSFTDFAGYFLLVCLFPIGIWIIQPKINKMMKE